MRSLNLRHGGRNGRRRAKENFSDHATGCIEKMLQRMLDTRRMSEDNGLCTIDCALSSSVVATWNLTDMDKVTQGAPLTMQLAYAGVPSNARVAIIGQL